MINYRQWLREAYQHAALMSEDTSTHNAAILLDPKTGDEVARGVNHYPGNFRNYPSCHKRPAKYEYVEHAERDVIYTCCRQGIQTRGLIMVCPWACCSDCARAIAFANIRIVIAHLQAFDRSPDRWKDSIRIGMDILREENVIYHLLDVEVGRCVNLFDGKEWAP